MDSHLCVEHMLYYEYLTYYLVKTFAEILECIFVENY
jgi:hypothetical protein